MGSHAASRNPGLDVARALAITLVVASHTVVEYCPPLLKTLLVWAGGAGVELFFSLSGFLIGGILLRLARDGITGPGIGRFLVRRWMRTLPLYYLGLFLHGWFLGRHSLHSYLLVQNFFPREQSPMIVSWSLVLEEYFYVLFPALLYVLAKRLPRGWKPASAVALAAVSLIVTCTALRVTNALLAFPIPVVDAYQNPILRLDCVAYGVLAACVVSERPALAAWLLDGPGRRWTSLVCVAVAVVSAALFVVIVHAADVLLTWVSQTWYFLYMAVQWPILEPVFAVLVVRLARARLALPRSVAAVIRHLSLTSYSIYIFHLWVGMMVIYYVPWLNRGLGHSLPLIVGTLLLSSVTYYGLERPILRLRDRLTGGGAARAGATPPRSASPAFPPRPAPAGRT